MKKKRTRLLPLSEGTERDKRPRVGIRFAWESPRTLAVLKRRGMGENLFFREEYPFCFTREKFQVRGGRRGSLTTRKRKHPPESWGGGKDLISKLGKEKQKTLQARKKKKKTPSPRGGQGVLPERERKKREREGTGKKKHSSSPLKNKEDRKRGEMRLGKGRRVGLGNFLCREV